MRSKNVANEQKTEPLTLWLRGEEGSKKMFGNRGLNTPPIVGDGERSRHGDFKGDKSLCCSDALHSILDNVDEYLLEKDGVKMNGYGFVGKTEFDLDMSLGTQVFKEWATGIHLLTEVAELQLRLWNLYHIGKAGNEGRKGGESLSLIARETADDARHTVVHLVSNHTDDALIGGFLSKTYF